MRKYLKDIVDRVEGGATKALAGNFYTAGTGTVFADGPEAWSATLENTSTDTLIVIVQVNTLTDLDNALDGLLVENSTNIPTDSGDISVMNSTTATDTAGDMQVVSAGGEAELDGDKILPFTWDAGTDVTEIPYVLGPGENVGVTTGELESGTFSSASINASVSVVYFEEAIE